jgi:SAM-dependent methyltransferase
VPQETIDGIYLDGRHYDRMYGSGGEDLPFWGSLAHQHGDPVLELACGTGRVALVLAQAGFNVTGLDRSEGMLREARRKSREVGLDVVWITCDMRGFHLERKFALIILPANALCHLQDLGDFEATMACIRKHLTPDGRFAIDVFVPRMELLIDRPGERSPFSEYDDPDGRGRICVTESYAYEPDTQIKRVTTHHAIPGVDGEIEGQLNLRMFFPQELDALLKYNGFALVGKYGSYDQAALDGRSEKQLIVCRLAAAEP